MPTTTMWSTNVRPTKTWKPVRTRVIEDTLTADTHRSRHITEWNPDLVLRWHRSNPENIHNYKLQKWPVILTATFVIFPIQTVNV